MAAEYGAESAVTELALGGHRAKKWNVTKKEGFQGWQMRTTAFLASKQQYANLVGVDEPPTHAKLMLIEPSYAAATESSRAQVLREMQQNVVSVLNTVYAYVLNSIDLSDDPAFERIVASTYAPDLVAKKPAKCWALLDALNAKGARTTRGAQDELEEAVNEYKPPFDSSPAEMARSLKHIVQCFDDLHARIRCVSCQTCILTVSEDTCILRVSFMYANVNRYDSEQVVFANAYPYRIQ